MVELQKQIQKTFTIRKEIKPECCWNNIYYEIIINNFLNSKIFPYKTAKHELPKQEFTPLSLEELK